MRVNWLATTHLHFLTTKCRCAIVISRPKCGASKKVNWVESARKRSTDPCVVFSPVLIGRKSMTVPALCNATAPCADHWPLHHLNAGALLLTHLSIERCQTHLTIVITMWFMYANLIDFYIRGAMYIGKFTLVYIGKFIMQTLNAGRVCDRSRNIVLYLVVLFIYP